MFAFHLYDMTRASSTQQELVSKRIAWDGRSNLLAVAWKKIQTRMLAMRLIDQTNPASARAKSGA